MKNIKESLSGLIDNPIKTDFTIPENCKDCLHYEVCSISIQKDFWLKLAMKLPNPTCNFFIEKANTITFPTKIGETVWVSPNNGKNFHTGKLYGINENGSYLVFVDDAVTNLVSFPLKKRVLL